MKKKLLAVLALSAAGVGAYFFIKNAKNKKYQSSCRKYVDCLSTLPVGGQDDPCEQLRIDLGLNENDCTCRKGDEFVKCS